ncbi:hypothetical protein BMF94_4821 [Rhodotorula taiwanensis]|uniref:Uncharacterized protein n=1 Tax=Rhodotorula taiwanensis TaxID=741276 RepID=A0A2S5B5X3_9BASI|nr:hypothetical protein BMF94_4821 [Rhodotorula taiwanensis]
MKVPSAAALPATRPSAYPRRRSPGNASLRSASASPNGSKRTSPTSVEMKRHAQMSDAQRQLFPLLEHEYREDVRVYMYEMQSKTMANAELIDQQPELRWHMRSYLVDFLVEIHLQHRLRPETLYLALNIVDRYISKRIVFKKHYQLVGCAALWIAAKFEDAKDRVPTLPELVDMCCNAYDEKAFVQMERHVLQTIQWAVGHPSAEAWLRLACVTGSLEDARTQHLARFLMELTLFHREFIQFYASDLSLASLLLARHMLGKSRRPHDESEPVLRVMLMLDELLGEHLEEVSPVVLKKLPEYLSPSVPVTPSRPLARSASSTSTASSSVPDYGSTPSSQRSDATCDTAFTSDEEESDRDDGCDDEDDDDEEEEPLTPLSPFVAGPTASDAMAAAAVAAAQAMHIGKENSLPPNSKPIAPRGLTVPVPRHPLEQARWEMNHQHLDAYGSQYPQPMSSSPPASSPSRRATDTHCG